MGYYGGESMNFLQYDNFDEFCLKNNFTPIQGLEILDAELEKIRSESK